MLLAAADSEFTQTGREYMLKEALDSIKEQYDYIVIDTPPTLGILVTNALTAADKLIIPVGAGDIFSLQGLTQFYGIIQNVRKYCNHELQISGLLITRYNSRSNVNQALKGQVQQIAEQMETKVFKAAIRESVSVKESQLLKEDLFEQAPRSNAAKDYQAFIREFLEGEV
ncbi:MAG: ATPase [Bacteriophage sp.]|nr:MAG: ATPase [Bacteriophage sp.]